jgi:hypothetical protein
MSRINRSRIVDGDAISASDLNDRFNDYSQSGALNQYNVRDSAIDLPQVKTDWYTRNIYETTLGELNLQHTSFNTVNATTGGFPVAGHVVQDFSAVPSVLNFGLSGLTVSTSEVLRLYYDLSVRPTYNGTPWTAVGSFSSYTFPDLPKTGTVQVATSADVWVLYPQWDVTSSALTNFVDVPNQGDFNTNYTGSRHGNALGDCMATTVIPAWVQFAAGALTGGVNAAGLYDSSIGWRGVSGAWHYAGSQVTVYGIRWIIKGILHPDQNGNVNYLGFDTVAGGTGSPAPQLLYTSGKAQAIVQRLS